MSNYEPPNSLNVELNFKDELKPVDSHNLILNFGADDGFSFARIKVKTSFKFSSSGKNSLPIDNPGNVRFKVKCRFLPKITGSFDINHIVGVSKDLNLNFRDSNQQLLNQKTLWSKSILRVLAKTLFFDKALEVCDLVNANFDRASSRFNSTHLGFNTGIDLFYNNNINWQENLKVKIKKNLYFDESIKIRINTELSHQEMIRKRRNISFSHQVAHVFEKRFSFDWDKGLELVTQDEIPWDKAKSIHYRKHPVKPWPEPEIPQYEGTGDLNFVCLCNDSDPHNIVLNFGADDCIPALPNREWWHILNSLTVTRLDNGEKILVYDGSYSTDRSRWCWSYSLTVPESEIVKLDPIDSKPIILKIVVNGNEHYMLLENRSRSRQFAKTTYVLTGRSQTALLSEPYAPVRSFLQENERTSVQLCQAELDRVFSEAVLNWQLIDELGWIVENNSLSYTNLAPMSVIKMVVESGGGFVYSEKNSNTLSIKPLYKKTFWDSLQIADYDRLIPESIVLNQSTDYELYPDYNGITLTNDRSGQHAQVKRRETSADVLLPPENNPLFNHVSMGSYGKSKLAKAGMIETHTFNMPITQQIGECIPGEIFAFNASWWGIVDSVSVSFNHQSVSQTVKVEHVNHE